MMEDYSININGINLIDCRCKFINDLEENKKDIIFTNIKYEKFSGLFSADFKMLDEHNNYLWVSDKKKFFIDTINNIHSGCQKKFIRIYKNDRVAFRMDIPFVGYTDNKSKSDYIDYAKTILGEEIVNYYGGDIKNYDIDVMVKLMDIMLENRSQNGWQQTKLEAFDLVDFRLKSSPRERKFYLEVYGMYKEEIVPFVADKIASWETACDGERALKVLLDLPRGTYSYERAVILTGDYDKILSVIEKVKEYVGNVLHFIEPNVFIDPVTNARKRDSKIAATGKYIGSQVIVSDAWDKKLTRNGCPRLKWIIKDMTEYGYSYSRKAHAEIGEGSSQPSGMLLIISNDKVGNQRILENGSSGYKTAIIEFGENNSKITVTDYAKAVLGHDAMPDDDSGLIPHEVITTGTFKSVLRNHPGIYN